MKNYLWSIMDHYKHSENICCKACSSARWLDINVILLTLLKLTERSRVRDVHLQQTARGVLRPGFIFWRVVGNGAHVDSAMRIVVSFLDKVTAELGTYGHGFSSGGFCRSCSISRIPANWLFAVSIAASSG